MGTVIVDTLQRKAFEYFEIHADEQTGLVADVGLPGSPSSIAASGFGLSCYPIAVERGWWTRDDAAEKTLTLLRFLAQSTQNGTDAASGYRGFYYHFLDMRTGKRAWESELSTIDTALLLCGVLTAAAFFHGPATNEREIRELAAMIYRRVDWTWALNGDRNVAMGWTPEGGFLPHRWRGYDEALPLYLLGLASETYPLPIDSYSAWGETFSWSGVDGNFLHAGPLFIHLFAHAWLDLRDIRDPLFGDRDTDYFRNTQRAIDQQVDYASRNPLKFTGYSKNLWGLTALDGARRDLRIGSKDVRFWGYLARAVPHGPDDGTIAPWASIACLPFRPDVSMRSLRHIIKNYGDVLIDGRFSEALNPTLHRRRGKARWRSGRVLGIDQGLIVMACENHRSEFVWNVTKSIEAFRRGMTTAGLCGGWLSE